MSTERIMVRDPPLDGVSSADNADPKDGADTVSDEELLSVACSNPDRIPDLLSGRGNPAARDLETGRTLLQLLVLAKANKDVLEAVLKRLNEEQINALDRSDDTALSLAVDIGNTETARLLLDCGALLNLRGQNRPLLHSACASGNEKMARLLIQHGADTTALVDEKTPIAAAIRGNSVPVISLLIENGVDVDAPADSDGYTPLMLACYWEYEDIVEYLVSEKGAQVNKAQQSTTKHDETELDAVTPLHLACQWNLLKSVKFLISKDADVRAVDSKSRTVLQRAAGYASAELVEYLVSLEQIVDLIDEENHKGRTPLLKAVRRNNFPAVEVLIKNGANVNIADKEGLTPLIVALRKDRSECLQMLLARKGINVNRQGKNDLAPLMIASTVSTNPATVKRMLELEASVDDVDSAGRTALHKASYLGHGDTVRILIEEGAADPQKKDHNDQNALHKAARRGYADIVQVILNSKADVGAVDNTGWTALHYASFCQFNWSDQKKVKEELGDHYCAEYNVNERGAGCYETTMKVLLAGGAKVHVRNNDSETALHLAARPGTFNEERVELLLYLMESYDTDSLRQIFAPQEIPVDGKNASKPPANQEDLQDRLFVWASKREARRFVLLLVRISKRLYYAEKFREVFSRKETQAWDTLHWAAYMGSGLLVWQLLHTMEQTVENDDGRKSALKVAQRMKQRLEEPAGKSQGRTPAEKMASPPSRKRKDDATADNSNAPNDVVEGYQNTIDVLSDPPFVPISKTTGDPCEKPQSNNTMSLFEVTISDFYVKDSQTGFLRRNRTVKDVICDKDPGTIMRYAKKWIEDMNVRLNKQVEVDDKVSDDKEFKFRWIHLPANNLQWMNDLIIAIGKEEHRSEEEFRALKSFFKKSCQEIPHGSSKSRLMKPNYLAEKTAWPCLERNLAEETTDKEKGSQKGQPNETKGDGIKSKQDTQEENMTAIYIPYIRFGKIDSEKGDDPRYKDLEKQYGDKIHGARTLDKFYYHTASDKELKKDMERRNQDQVVSKELHGEDLKTREIRAWKLLRIDELFANSATTLNFARPSTHTSLLRRRFYITISA